MEKFESNYNRLPEDLALKLKDYVAPMPEALRFKYTTAIASADVEELFQLSEKMINQITYEQEKSDDRCASLKDVLKQLELWLDNATK